MESSNKLAKVPLNYPKSPFHILAELWLTQELSLFGLIRSMFFKENRKTCIILPFSAHSWWLSGLMGGQIGGREFSKPALLLN